MNQTRKEKARLRSAKHRAWRKTEVEELKREGEKLKNVLEYLRANAPDHWLAVQPILHRETTKEPINDPERSLSGTPTHFSTFHLPSSTLRPQSFFRLGVLPSVTLPSLSVSGSWLYTLNVLIGPRVLYILAILGDWLKEKSAASSSLRALLQHSDWSDSVRTQDLHNICKSIWEPTVWVSFAETGLAGLNLSLHGTLCPSTGLLQNLISLCGTCRTQFVPPRAFYKNSI